MKSILIILGATGDLSINKLIPTILQMNDIHLVAVSRRNFTNDQYRDFLISKNSQLNKIKEIELDYLNIDFSDVNNFDLLEQFINKQDLSNSQLLIYVATSADYYEIIVNALSSIQKNINVPFKLLLEKPYGKTIENAIKINDILSKSFDENCIYRVDHYLHKEVLQNILMFRFSNSIFKSIWNNKQIEKIEICFLESDTVENRIDFYDGIGALRDVGQNHVLQMIAAVTMEQPKDFSATEIRYRREQIFEDIKLTVNPNDTVLGQYKDYQQLKPNSTTETYFETICYVNNKELIGVPIIVKAGKNLPTKQSSIKIYFKGEPNCFCNNENETTNVLTFNISPSKNIVLQFWLKDQNNADRVHEEMFKYTYNDEQSMDIAYKNVLTEAINGDQTNFPSSREALLGWKFIESIYSEWGNKPLQIY